ncbi:MAG: sporulation protein YabP [Lachnospiraceae bacterium]|nr:sporulation protein YabP [Lachnospiraceae bacterium]MBO5144929.1 sporulation protein YabP [Lachnospiraceae bacterium]
MENNSANNIGKHRFSMEQRRDCKITGVVEIHSFDENNILMETVDGMLAIKGNNLHVSRLNLEKGEADVDGKVDSLTYSDKSTLAKKGEGLLTRLFS